MGNLANFRWPTDDDKSVVTADEKDERITGAHYASEAAAHDLPQTARPKKAKAKAAVVKPSKDGLKTYRVRLTIEGTKSTADEIKAILVANPGTRVTRIREVA